MSGRDGGTGRGRGDDRRRRRDRSDRDRGDRDFDRPRHRDRERDEETGPIPGPVVLLKRPGTLASSNSNSSLNAGGSSQSSLSQLNARDKDSSTSLVGKTNSSGGPGGDYPTKPLLLHRSSNVTKKILGNLDLSSQSEGTIEKPKTPGPFSALEMLKPPCYFPSEKAVTLIDGNMKVKPISELEFLNNGKSITDYFVITAVGKSRTGKSSLLSYLSCDDDFGKKTIFSERTREQEMDSLMYITEENVVFIEMASLFDSAAAHDLINSQQQGTLETTTLTWNLRLMRWAISVSHVVLIVSDNLMDPNLFQLMNSAEIIHSMESALGEGIFPEIIYVCNKAPLSHFHNDKTHSKFQDLFRSVLGRNPRVQPNYFLLPNSKWTSEVKRFKEFKDKLYAFNRYNRAPFAPEVDLIAKFPQKYSLQEWFSNATKSWDDMQSSAFFASYVKLLP